MATDSAPSTPLLRFFFGMQNLYLSRRTGKMRLSPLISALAMAAITSTAEAQRQCKKGIPCGGTCISATKTCHIGVQKPTESDTTLHRAGAPAEDQRSLIDRVVGRGPRTFVGSVDGDIYYLSSCVTAIQKLTEDERVYFASEEEARAKGYKRSKANSC
jgi:hypothetical protein